MRLRKNHCQNTQQAVFNLEVDFDYEAKEKYGLLRPGHTYYFRKSNRMSENDSNTSYSDIVDYIVNIVNSELKTQCQECPNVSIEEVKVIKSYSGSINVIFSVIFNTLGLISGLKDLYDFVEIIKKLSEAHIKTKMEGKYGDVFDIRIRTIAPNREYYCHDKMENIVAVTHKTRDAFFYYLLISNIILLAVIALLVYKAVLAMYW